MSTPKVDERTALDAFRTLLAFFAQGTSANVAEPHVSHYSSAKRGPHPAGKSARWCRDTFSGIPGARRIGRDWTISVSAFEAWADDQARARRVARASKGAAVANDVASEASRFLAASGARATKAAAR